MVQKGIVPQSITASSQYIFAPLASACSSVSITITPAPSLMTKPALMNVIGCEESTEKKSC